MIMYSNPKVLQEGSEEYQKLIEFARLLTANSPHRYHYKVDEIYYDVDQAWMWTTIVNTTKQYRALSPRQWGDVIYSDRDPYDILADILSDPCNPDYIF